MKNLLPITYVVLLLMACGTEKRSEIDFTEWGNYWFQGKAEISSFDLVQYRYGEAREGEGVLIFVTEDFSRKKHVKLDDPEKAGRDKISVLKMNQTRDFVTGIYPYHMMLSAFTPTKEKSYGLKFTASSQEWCGQTYTQVNKKNESSYQGKLYSYFEAEGDASFTVNGIMEDDLWNLIRINPSEIPLGSVKILPSLLYQRLSHKEFEAEDAFIKLSKLSESRSIMELNYSSGFRSLEITFEHEFPFPILEWKETQTKSNGDKEITHAKRKAVKIIDYWKRNKLEDEFLRDELKLRF
ncbi:hypothetical protein [Cecembia rubra]|uniref:Septum formation inhibitor Maf n=1 Tax=Cecembia rubra TaxID=1485585 RepID=A0A2P8E6A8_9BACT|nr:hypothetical protein [Cecembia rubra]PSL05006.1 hypothetical protein CLV48_104180 [Cecembia rubra]